MPKDGAQLQLMLASLDTQEQALRQLFCGTTVVDTTEQIVLFTPEHETESQLLFRFSKKLGLVDADDLAGSPYYISVRDLHATAAAPASDANQKKNAKEESCVRVNLPGKIEVTLTHNGEQWANTSSTLRNSVAPKPSATRSSAASSPRACS